MNGPASERTSPPRASSGGAYRESSYYEEYLEGTVPCPLGNGRLYFRLGAAPKHMGDREAYWDFIEYASENSESWHGNTTQVDAFCIPITIEMGGRKVGIAGPRRALFAQFREEAP